MLMQGVLPQVEALPREGRIKQVPQAVEYLKLAWTNGAARGWLPHDGPPTKGRLTNYICDLIELLAQQRPRLDPSGSAKIARAHHGEAGEE